MTVKATPAEPIPRTAAGIANRSKRFFPFIEFSCEEGMSRVVAWLAEQRT